jgi:ADP-heptose:LPS heptosyltransferase
MAMNKLPLIGHMVAFNEAPFIGPAIRSVIGYLDKLVVIEGAWMTSATPNCAKRSNDGTLQILYNLQKELGKDKLEIHHCNEPEQLGQRSLHFKFYPKPHWMFLIDADEIYEPEAMEAVVKATERADFEVFQTRSLTFVNDRHHHCIMDWPRLFRINSPGYKFVRPNHLLKPNGTELSCCEGYLCEYYHYSYVRHEERMQQKIRDRVNTHLQFAWEIQDGWVKRKGLGELQWTDHIPEIVRDHPLLQKKAPEEAFEYRDREKIGFTINSGMGNMILATPMLQALRDFKPNARISVLTWPRGADVIQGWDVVDDVITHHHNNYLYHNGGLDYLLCSPTAFIEHPAVLSQCRNIVKLPSKPQGIWAKHEAEYNMDLVRNLGYTGPTPHPICFPGHDGSAEANALRKAIGFDKKYAVISAGYLRNGHWWKKSPKNDGMWHNVIDHLLKDYYVFLMGAPEDHTDAELLVQPFQSHRVKNLCGATSIKTACAIIRDASLFVGLDGGLGHVAACFRVPSVVLWTFTNPIKNLPINKSLKLVAQPCNKRNVCQHGFHEECPFNQKCREISADMVIKKIGELT